MIPAWMKDANCKGRDLELFFPHHDNQTAYARAREICLACPVRQTCLDYAIDTDTWDGMFGAMSPRERRAWLTSQEVYSQYGTYHGDAEGTPKGWYREKRAGVRPCEPCRLAYNADTYARQRKQKVTRAYNRRRKDQAANGSNRRVRSA